jgi:hypothetical protein
MTATTEERLAALESKLHEFEAKEEIREVLFKFCRGVDRNDQECISEVYHPEAVADHGEFVIRIEDMPARYGPALPGQVGNMHLLGNIFIELDGDVAFTESYFLAVRQLDREGGSSTRIRGGRYVDRFERRNGRWKILERVLVDEWSRIDDVVAEIGPRNRYHRGTKDKTDPLYTIKRGRVARNAPSEAVPNKL